MKKTKGKKISQDGKFLIGFIIVAVVLLGLIVYFESKKYDDYKDSGYTTFGRVDNGFKGIYLSCEEYGKQEGFKTSRLTKYIRFAEEGSIVVIVSPDPERVFYATEAEDIKERVEEGGVVIFLEAPCEETDEDVSEGYFTAEYFLLNDDGYTTENVGGTLSYTTYNFNGGGKFIDINGAETNGIINLGLKESNEKGAAFLRLLKNLSEKHNNANVIFDEFYVGIEDGVTADILGVGFILFLVLLGITIVLFLLSKAVTFGAPVHVVSLEHRAELEHVESLAKLYKRTGSNSIAFDIYMETLIGDISDFLEKRDGIKYDKEEIIEMSKTDEALKKIRINELVDLYTGSQKKKLNEKKLKSYISYIERVRKEL